MRIFHLSPLLLVLLAPAAHASQPEVSVASDALLAQARGRGLPATAITGFRLELASSWIGAQGALEASAAVQVDGLGRARPQVQFASSAGGSGIVSGTRTGNAAGALQVQGVGQLTQVAGNANVGSNGFIVRLADTSTALTSMPAAGSLGARYVSGEGSASASGDGRGGVVLEIATPLGVAAQSIGAAGGYVSQMLRIVGDGQRVSNRATLTVMTASATAQATPALLGQLRNMMPRR
jgi:hypothetical protein